MLRRSFYLILNTKGRTDFGSFVNEGTADYFHGDFNDSISFSIKPYLENESESSFSTIRFECLHCLFHRNMIEILCSCEYKNVKRHYLTGRKAHFNRYMKEMCSKVNDALNDLKIDFPISRVHFGSYCKRIMYDRFWIPVEKNESRHRVYWYRVQAVKTCLPENTDNGR